MLRASSTRVSWDIDPREITTLGIALATMVVAYLVTLQSGGTHSPFPHLFYVPVLIIAVRWGIIPGVFTGLIAGVLCGPFMPLNTADATPQSSGLWMVRGGFFIGVGMLTGGLAEMMRQRHERVERFHRESIRAFVRTIDAKSAYTAQHSERVATFASSIGQQLGMSSRRCNDLYWSGLLHDIGKLSIPDTLLDKEGPLTEEEWDTIKQHPVESQHFLRDIEEFKPYLPSIRSHHERFDGTGYPDGLAGYDIPFDARVLAVADALEAMTAARPYRGEMPEAAALDELERYAGSQFDPVIVQATLRAMRERTSISRPAPGTSPYQQSDPTRG